MGDCKVRGPLLFLNTHIMLAAVFIASWRVHVERQSEPGLPQSDDKEVGQRRDPVQPELSC